MPPEVMKIPLPSSDHDRGPAAQAFLRAHGVVPRVPTLRSSDYGLCLGNPYLYYLIRRLGLVRRLSWSKATSRGSWFHAAWEFEDLPGAFEQSLTDRMEELKAACQSMGVVGDKARDIIENERRAAALGKAAYEGSKLVQISQKVRSWNQLVLESGLFRVLGREVLVDWEDPEEPGMTMVAQYDALLLHMQQNRVWVLDFKSVDGDATGRLQTCPIEFQTQHYIHGLRTKLLGDPDWVKEMGLPEDVQCGGMIHVAVSTPSIVFGMGDRDYKLVDFTPTRGKNKGVTRQEKEYIGEPKYENYLKRVRHWYNSSGDYEELKKEREAEPLVNLSYTTPDCLDGDNFTEYRSRVKFVADHARREPNPDNFLRGTDLRSYGKLSDWAPFFLCPVRQWPEIIRSEGFMLQFRDEELMEAV